ncbi:MAG: hypothetical protein Q8N39_10395 [Pelolinea sp.]|nr:hypothetical protein [Pelolinea sp.]
MISNAGAANPWENQINNQMIISGSAVIPQLNNDFLPNISSYINTLGKDIKDKDLRRKLNEIVIDYLEAHSTQEKELFNLQKCYGRVIFISSIVLVFSGLILSFIQFYIALILNGGEQPITEVSFKATGEVLLKSPLIGVVILITSLAFFYLFLKFLYMPKKINLRLLDQIIKLRTSISTEE